MTVEEIHEKITENNKLIESLLNPNIFTLNNKIRDLLKENAALQTQCPHLFVGGYCKYCLMEEPQQND
jgi:hypothetical protein